MKYDFKTYINRSGQDAIAVDCLGNDFAPAKPKMDLTPIPMWIADMNFPTVPTVQEAMIERIKHPIFGYFPAKKEYTDAIIKWQEHHHQVQGLLPDHIGYENGVLGGVISAISTMCSRGDRVLVNSPTYNGFWSSLENAGFRMEYSPLVQDEAGVWRLDLEDMEQRITKNNIHAAVFCSPHNPTGRVWTMEEVTAVMELFRKHDVYVVSDEIWSDIVLHGSKHIPTQSVSEDARNRTVALYAPSKTFNIAGLVGSYHIIYNERLRHRVDKEASVSHYNNMNVLSMYALIGAYQPEGYEWLGELRDTLADNVDKACDYVKEHFEGVTVKKPEGTYLMWLDCREWCEKHGKTYEELVQMGWDCGVTWADGAAYQAPGFIRMNIALPLEKLMEALERLSQYVFGA